jgi:hypothetical protein
MGHVSFCSNYLDNVTLDKYSIMAAYFRHCEPSQAAKQSPFCTREIASVTLLPRNDTWFEM